MGIFRNYATSNYNGTTPDSNRREEDGPVPDTGIILHHNRVAIVTP